MANVLSNYDPIFYANEALIQLRKNLGLAARVHRGYDPTPQQRGSTINIPRPTSFTATEVNPTTGGTTQDIDAGNVDPEAFLDGDDEHEHSGDDVSAVARTELKNGVHGNLLG